MKKQATLSAILTAALISFCTPIIKAQESFDLNALSADEINASAADGQKSMFSFAPVDAAHAQPQKEWTVMIFMNAKNDLSQSQFFGLSGKWALRDLAEMKKVGSTGKVNIVVEYGATGQGSKRMLIGKSGVISSGETVYSRDPKADMGDYKRVIEFAKWSKTNFPAKKYMFILWNHGLGWLDPAPGAAPSGGSNKGILFDEETNNYVRTRQLGEILRQTGYVDVFAMNACLMQMAEVAYEVKDNAGLIVASEETMLAQGFDYEKLLLFMNANARATDEQLSDFFINSCRDFYAAGANLIGPINLPLNAIPGTLSTVRARAVNQLPAYLNALAGAAMKNNEIEAVKIAVGNVIRFTGHDPKNDKKKLLAPYADLYDFARLMETNARAQDTRRAAADLMNFIKSGLVVRSIGINSDTANGYNYSAVGGIAINMTMKLKKPPAQVTAALANAFETKYSDLALSKASLWDEFVSWTNDVWNK
jgi:hypothetical protein